MSRCDVVGADKPQVWKDDDGWTCSQTTVCRTCKAMSITTLAEDATWTEAMQASTEARPVEESP